MSVTALFVGPDDNDTCDTGGPDDEGCEGAVNNNPYTLDTVPEPGEFACMSRCRHMVQIDGEAPDDVPTVDWSSSLGFSVADDAADAAGKYYGGDTHDEATGEDNTLGGWTKLPDLTNDEAAIVDMAPDEIAQYIADNGLSIEDVNGVMGDDEVAQVRAYLQDMGYIGPDDADASGTVSDALGKGDVEGASAMMQSDESALEDAKQLAAQGFSEDDSDQAYYLAEALNDADPAADWFVVYDPDTGTWRVEDKAAAIASNITKKTKEAGFSDDQPRDDHGRWSAGGSTATTTIAGGSPRVIVPVSAGEGKDRYSIQNVKTPNGGFVRGTPIAWNDPRIPDTVYHVTTNFKGVEAKNMLLASGAGGLGGDSRDQIVSFTISKPIADGLKRDMQSMASIARAVGPEPAYDSDEHVAWGRKLFGLWKDEAKGQGWEFNPGKNYDDDGVYRRYGFGDWQRMFYIWRDSSPNSTFHNPIFFGAEQPYWASIDANNVGTVAIPRSNLNTGALVTNFDLGEHSLEEIRVYGDVPIHNHVREAGFNVDQARDEHGRWTSMSASDMLRKVAIIHANAKHDPSNPATVATYNSFKTQVLKQYSDLLNKGYRFDFSDKDPYPNSAAMRADVDATHHLKVYNVADLPTGHPLADMTPYGQTYNTIFRGVHDMYGHYFPQNQFGPKGELAAYQAHAKMFTPDAIPALAAETLAQNAWVNYGPHHPENLPPAQRPFADQKAYAFPSDVAIPIAHGLRPHLKESVVFHNDLPDEDYRRPRHERKVKLLVREAGFRNDQPRNAHGQWEAVGASNIPKIEFEQTTDHASFNAELERSKHRRFFTFHDAEHFANNGKGYWTPDHKTGYFLDNKGDLQNLYNNGRTSGAGTAGLLDAIQRGAKTLDCYDGVLPRFYAKAGFREIGRMKFDPQYAPAGWENDPELKDRPDVVQMQYRGPEDRSTIRDHYGGYRYRKTKRYV